MPSSIGEFLQNYLAIAQFREGIRQNRVAEGSQRAQQLIGFVNLARQTQNPADQAALVQTFAGLGVAPPETLQQLLAGTAPTAEVVQAGSLQRGVSAVRGTPQEAILDRETAFQQLTGRGWGDTLQSNFLGQLFEGAGTQLSDVEKGILSEGLLTRTATGMDPGAFAMSRTLSNLPEEQLLAGSQIGIGTRMNAAQEAGHGLNVRQFQEGVRQANQQFSLGQGQLSLGWAQHRLANRQFEAGNALQIAQMQLESAQAGAGAGGGIRATAVPDLLQTQRNLMQDLQQNAQRMTPQQIEMYLRSIDNTGQALQSAGYDAIRIQDPSNTGQVFQPGFWSYTKKAFGIGR